MPILFLSTEQVPLHATCYFSSAAPHMPTALVQTTKLPLLSPVQGNRGGNIQASPCGLSVRLPMPELLAAHKALIARNEVPLPFLYAQSRHWRDPAGGDRPAGSTRSYHIRWVGHR